MSVIDEIIRLEPDSSLSFGNFLSKEKKKVSNFEVNGNLYSIKTHDQITRIDKNGMLLLETVPGAAIHNFKMTQSKISFIVVALKDINITLELFPETRYIIFENEKPLGESKTNITGKISINVNASAPVKIEIIKKS